MHKKHTKEICKYFFLGPFHLHLTTYEMVSITLQG